MVQRNDVDDGGPLPEHLDTLFVVWRCERTGLFKMRWPSSDDDHGSKIKPGARGKSPVTVQFDGKVIKNRLDYTVFMYDGARLEDGDTFVVSCGDLCGRTLALIIFCFLFCNFFAVLFLFSSI